jgi:hypothetical protein
LQSSIYSISNDREINQIFVEKIANNNSLISKHPMEKFKCDSGIAVVRYEGQLIEVKETDALEFKKQGLVKEYICR